MRKFLFLLLGLCAVFQLSAQKGDKATIRGNIYDKNTAEPLGFVTVKLEGAAIGASSDVNGFFSIANIPVGTYKLIATYVGYDNFEQEVTVKRGEIAFLNIYLTESAAQIEEVVISAKKEIAKTETRVSTISVTPKQIRSLPSAGGQADIAQYLTVLPGVIFTGDQGGQLYIRGGSPVQNRILLDGMTIYNPFHSIGFFSVYETELIRNVDVLTGGFNADYGGRISAIVDVKTREGNRKRLSGLVSGGPFQIKGLIEGPIVPLRKEGGGSVSFVMTGKKAIINQIDQQLYSYVNDGAGVPFEYQDIYGKISFLTGNGSKFNVFGFNYDDGVSTNLIDFGWSSSGGGMDFSIVPSSSNTIIGGTLTYSGYDSRSVESDRRPRNSGISGYFAGLNFTNFGRNDEVKYGLELTGFSTNFTFENFRGLDITQNENTTEISGFVKWRRKAGPLVIEPGFRLQYYQSLGEISPEPRLSIKYNITDFLRLKLAGGLYSQNLLSTVNERDIVNLFVGFLSGPESAVYKIGEEYDEPGAETVDHRLQKAWHAVGGFEIDLLSNLDVNIEGYYKDFTQLFAINRNKVDARAPDYVVETGKAYGLDFSGKFEGKRSYLWAAYSLGFVTRFDGRQTYPPVFDRRHNMNLVGTYLLGKTKKWELGARWNLGSGFPFTLTQGFFTSHNFNNGINTDILGGNGGAADLGIIYAADRNTGRLPYYHRLDISLKRGFKFGKHGLLEVTAAATNAYDRQNIFYFDRVRYERVNQLPILPSLSMTVQW
jgi:CarboxypepD_reg-like domain/TonB-dependent Receptor Plug Domain